MCRQAVEKDRIGFGHGHQCLINLERGHRRQLVVGMFLPHRNPGIGDEHIRTGSGLRSRIEQIDPRAALTRLFDPVHLRLITLRRADADVELEQPRRLENRMEHIVAIAQPCQFEPRQSLAVLDHRQQVGHDLARVRGIGQPVDDRHAGIFCHFLDLGVIVGTDHDRIGHAAEHARGVGNAFATPELAARRIEHQCTAAELSHRDVEADARTGRAFLEDHRKDMTVERAVRISLPPGPAHARRLAIDRIVDHRRDGIGPGIRKIEEMCHQLVSGTW